MPKENKALKIFFSKNNQIDVEFYDIKNSDSVNNILSESLSFAEKNLVDIPKKVREDIKITVVENVDEVLKIAYMIQCSI